MPESLQSLRAPLPFLTEILGTLPARSALEEYGSWWEPEGQAISDAIDRMGTPVLRMSDRFGKRIDEILFPREYWTALRKGYQAGAVWRAFCGDTLKACGLIQYITCFYDPGMCCPYVVSLSTAMALANHGDGPLKERFLPLLLRRDAGVWQGATWMTEAGGGSDLGATVETVARRDGERWLLTGDKYFASNVGAELAIVAARPEGAPAGVRGLALFLVPRLREDGTLNYWVRRLKEKIATRSVPTGEVELHASEAFLLGKPGQGVYLILEALNLSRAANSMGSVALAQRAMKEALAFASQRRAFGKPLLEHPLMRKQFEERRQALRAALALAWESVRRLEEVRSETAPYSERYHAFRLIAHLAKYWTAELAVQTAKWAMEVHGGAGALAEYPVERWLREAMILAIWEGPAHRQILDGLETMERFHAHRTIFEDLAKDSSPPGLDAMARRIEDHLALDATEREALAEELFRDLAVFIGESLLGH